MTKGTTMPNADERAAAVVELDGAPAELTIDPTPTLRVRGLPDRHLIREIPLPPGSAPRFSPSVKFTAELDGSPVAITRAGRTVEVWDLAAGQRVSRIRTDTSLAPTGSGGIFVIATGDDTSPDHMATGLLHGRPVLLTTSSSPQWIWIYDLATGKPYNSVRADGHLLGTADLDGHLIALTSCRVASTREVRATDVITKKQRATLPVHAATTTTAVIDGQTVVVTAGEHLQAWDLATGTPRGEPLTGLPPSLMAMATASLQGRPILVATNYKRTTRAWDLATGASLTIGTLPQPGERPDTEPGTVLSAVGGVLVRVTSDPPAQETQDPTP